MTPNDKPLNDEEKAVMRNAGWKFLNENHIYIPDDYDGCMAYGIRSIRRILEEIRRKRQG